MVTFATTMVIAPKVSYAQEGVLGLPQPGTMVNLSPAYVPLMLTGLTVHPENPLLMDFIVSTGNSGKNSTQVKKESERLIKYFLACLTIPENNQWVNLSPYEKQRIIPEDLGQTVLGQDMLAQDYILKQLTASLIYPEKNLGRNFWDKVYAKARQMYGTTQIPMNTFNKVWILPDTAQVYEHKDTVLVVKSHLKVMLDEDYLSLQKHNVILSEAKDLNKINSSSVNNLGSQIVRQIILPAIEEEVNTGKNFAQLRQIYNSMILAFWFKNNLKAALLNQVYTDKSKVNGVNVDDPAIKEKIYKQYLQAYKKGVFNYIKEEVDQSSQEVIPRKYFSGGLVPVVSEEKVGLAAEKIALESAPAGNVFDRVSIGLEKANRVAAAMTASKEDIKLAGQYLSFLDKVESVKDIDEPFSDFLERISPTFDLNELLWRNDRIEEFFKTHGKIKNNDAIEVYRKKDFSGFLYDSAGDVWLVTSASNDGSGKKFVLVWSENHESGGDYSTSGTVLGGLMGGLVGGVVGHVLGGLIEDDDHVDFYVNGFWKHSGEFISQFSREHITGYIDKERLQEIADATEINSKGSSSAMTVFQGKIEETANPLVIPGASAYPKGAWVFSDNAMEKPYFSHVALVNVQRGVFNEETIRKIASLEAPGIDPNSMSPKAKAIADFSDTIAQMVVNGQSIPSFEEEVARIIGEETGETDLVAQVKAKLDEYKRLGINDINVKTQMWTAPLIGKLTKEHITKVIKKLKLELNPNFIQAGKLMAKRLVELNILHEGEPFVFDIATGIPANFIDAFLDMVPENGGETPRQVLEHAGLELGQIHSTRLVFSDTVTPEVHKFKLGRDEELGIAVRGEMGRMAVPFRQVDSIELYRADNGTLMETIKISSEEQISRLTKVYPEPMKVTVFYSLPKLEAGKIQEWGYDGSPDVYFRGMHTGDASMTAEEVGRLGFSDVVQRNIRAGVISSEKERAVLKLLSEVGEQDLLNGWESPGINDQRKRDMLKQIADLNDYVMGLVRYKKAAVEYFDLLKNDKSPFPGAIAKVPESVDLTDPTSAEFKRYSKVGMDNVDKLAFMLSAGGMGERLGELGKKLSQKGGVKIEIQVNPIAEQEYIANYAANILALQDEYNKDKAPEHQIKIPLFIMVSDETYDRTVKLFAENNDFGFDGVSIDPTPEDIKAGKLKQVVIARQQSVPTMVNSLAKFTTVPGDPYRVETKPHNHVDMHHLMIQTGVSEEWERIGKSTFIHIQDTNAQAFNVIPAFAGVTIENNLDGNILGVNRRPGDNVGCVVKMVDQQGVEQTYVVEYNQIKGLLTSMGKSEADFVDEQGNSLFPGNTNVLAFKASTFNKILKRTGGVFSEMLNLKLPDLKALKDAKPGEVVTFQIHPRLEAMVQDAFKMREMVKVFSTKVANLVGFMTTKNSTPNAITAIAKGNNPEALPTAQAGYYRHQRFLLAQAYVDIDVEGQQRYAFEGDYQNVKGISFQEGAYVSLPFMLPYQAKNMFLNGGSVSSRSFLIVNGPGKVVFDHLDLDGSLVINTVKGAHVVAKRLSVRNRGMQRVFLTASEVNDPNTPIQEAMQGYRFVHSPDTKVINIPGPGNYEIDSNGQLITLSSAMTTVEDAEITLAVKLESRANPFGDNDQHYLSQAFVAGYVLSHLDRPKMAKLKEAAISKLKLITRLNSSFPFDIQSIAAGAILDHPEFFDRYIQSSAESILSIKLKSKSNPFSDNDQHYLSQAFVAGIVLRHPDRPEMAELKEIAISKLKWITGPNSSFPFDIQSIAAGAILDHPESFDQDTQSSAESILSIKLKSRSNPFGGNDQHYLSQAFVAGIVLRHLDRPKIAELKETAISTLRSTIDSHGLDFNIKAIAAGEILNGSVNFAMATNLHNTGINNGNEENNLPMVAIRAMSQFKKKDERNKKEKEVALNNRRGRDRDHAALAVPGGIDLNSRNLKMESEGQKVSITFDPAMIAQFRRGDFSGVRIKILDVVPIDLTSLLALH